MITKDVEINIENKYWLQVWELLWHRGHKIKEWGIMSLELDECWNYEQSGPWKHVDISMTNQEGGSLSTTQLLPSCTVLTSGTPCGQTPREARGQAILGCPLTRMSSWIPSREDKDEEWVLLGSNTVLSLGFCSCCLFLFLSFYARKWTKDLIYTEHVLYYWAISQP